MPVNTMEGDSPARCTATSLSQCVETGPGVVCQERVGWGDYWRATVVGVAVAVAGVADAIVSFVILGEAAMLGPAYTHLSS